MLRTVVTAISLGGLTACAPLSICGEDREVLVGERCVLSDDCPRPGQIGVCLNDRGNENPCVLCAAQTEGAPATQCVLITPVEC